MAERVTITISGDSSAMTEAIAKVQELLVKLTLSVETQHVRPGRIETFVDGKRIR